MRMHNPPHPGEILSELWLEPLGLNPAEIAPKLKMSSQTLNAIVEGQAPIDPETALRLELAFGKSAESWLAHQAAFDLWQLEASREQLGITRIQRPHPSEIQDRRAD